MGFTKVFIDMIWRQIVNNWYSIIINGQSYGLFHSKREIKQEDLLLPASFILTSEVLSKALNALFEKERYKQYMLPK